MQEAPFLSIVIVHWNGKARLRRCLTALCADLQRSEETVVEVVVVDNASEDRPRDLVAELLPSARLIELSENLGFAGGANVGIDASSGEWIATLNNDAEVEIGWIEALARAARKEPAHCGMLQPRMVQRNDRERIDTTGIVLRRGGSFEDRGRDEPVDAAQYANQVFCVSAGAGWYRRGMLEAVAREGRFFDSEFFMYFEDVDLGWRCRLAGWSAAYVPDAIVRHERHGSSGDGGGAFVKRQCARNRLRVVLANASWRYVAGALPRLAKDAGWLIRELGPRALRDVMGATRGGLVARLASPPASRRARRRIESQWFGTS